MKNLQALLLFLILTIGLFAVSAPAVADTADRGDTSFVLQQEDTNSTETTTTDDGSDDGSDDDEFEDADNDGVDDDKEKAYEREIDVESEDDRFRAKSTLKNGTTKDTFEVEFDVQSNNAAELEFEYANEVSLNGTANETELSYKVKFDELVEFVDEGTPGYENETVLQSYEIGNVGWNTLIVEYNATTGFVKVNATSADGVFTLIMKLTSSFLNSDNATLSPNSLKIDVIVNNFAYSQAGSKLAVKTHIQTESELSVETESEDEIEGIAKNETQLGITAANATGFFSWSEIAYADGQLIDVIASTVSNSTDEEGANSSKIYFTFNSTASAENIVWDPKLGVVSEAAKSNLPQSTPPVDDPTPTDTGTSTPTDTSTPSETSSDTNTATDTGSDDTVPDDTGDDPAETSPAPFGAFMAILALLGIPLVRRRST